MDQDLTEFVEGSLDSVWSLELLLVLHQRAERVWTADELIAELRSSQVVVRKSIDNLLASGLIVAETEDAFRYGPASPDQNQLVEQLESAYRVKPAAVRRLIVRSASDKLKSFANAFKIMKD